MSLDVIIVGAGLAGLSAGRILRDAGKRVLLLDKGRSVGGRMATRRIGAGVADHGAQFFTVREPEFQALVDHWLAGSVVFEWSRGWSDGSLAATRDGHPRYAATGGMNALTKHMAQGLDVRVNAPVRAVRKLADGWAVELVDGEIVRGSAVILTAPVPQALALCEAGDLVLPEAQKRALTAIRYDPCLTALYEVEGQVNLPSPGAIQRPHANLSWLADNKRKGISSTQIITVQASGPYSVKLWEASDADVLKAFRVDLMPFFDEDAQILSTQVKRWKYSLVTSPHPERCLLVEEHDAQGSPMPLVFAGDAFGFPGVEGAVMSGMAAANALL